MPDRDDDFTPRDGGPDDETDDAWTDASDGERASGPGADEQYCASCGEVVKTEAEICPSCGVRQQGATSGGEKNPGIAALLSFLIIGAGQIYNGQLGKGIGLMVIQVINVLLMFVIIGFFTYLLTWGYAVYDAHATAERINAGEI